MGDRGKSDGGASVSGSWEIGTRFEGLGLRRTCKSLSQCMDAESEQSSDVVLVQRSPGQAELRGGAGPCRVEWNAFGLRPHKPDQRRYAS